ncbi:MAG: hypothetical protein COV31_00860 [Candidatus Yanofskybacteria bacterium CG10_big_fil_rev_8_21_14_0_10_46_23]|uniref:Uncharacterized protein n=1 Tax=Candidatus Yanofskybacteria bacterium CG10_big_fil_rev_8_21_14_0_10_46_23 TaxID=1975098 RepID=A0A2H0R4G9_9BACT|nr:MAG: hypothetical protein COV31_00860 [Candidatus Yanofskybacteria bacterium CG10_big_fil_rev_8_21_14_0_10_46_23]
MSRNHSTALAVIAGLVIIGGAWWLASGSKSETANLNQELDSADPQTLPVAELQAEIEALEQTGSSNEVVAIEADLEASNFSNLDAELDQLIGDINSLEF